MPTTARRRRRLDTGGPWGTGLLLLGLGLTANGIGYISANRSGLPDALQSFSESVPMWFWGGIWVAAGVYSVVKALNPPQRHVDVWAAIAVTSLWSAAYLIAWGTNAWNGDLTREWTSALAWGMLAGLVSCHGRCVNPLDLDRAR